MAVAMMMMVMMVMRVEVLRGGDDGYGNDGG